MGAIAVPGRPAALHAACCGTGRAVCGGTSTGSARGTIFSSSGVSPRRSKRLRNQRVHEAHGSTEEKRCQTRFRAAIQRTSPQKYSVLFSHPRSPADLSTHDLTPPLEAARLISACDLPPSPPSSGGRGQRPRHSSAQPVGGVLLPWFFAPSRPRPEHRLHSPVRAMPARPRTGVPLSIRQSPEADLSTNDVVPFHLSPRPPRERTLPQTRRRAR